MPPKRIKPEQRLDFRLTLQERDLIIERTFIDAEMEGRLRAASPFGSRLILQLTLDDMDDLAGHVAAEANHCAEPRVRRALEAVYHRLANIEASFTDERARPGAAIEEARPFTVKQRQYLAFIYPRFSIWTVPNGHYATPAAPIVPTFSSCSVHRLEDGRRDPFQP